jgi:hypothetical protein
MNSAAAAAVGETMRLWLMLAVGLCLPASALAQDASEGDDVRSAEEIPEDMPPPPDDAPPAEAPPVDGTDERPPHPETPEDLEELQPTAETLAKTSYHWLPGHWKWTGEQFEWKSGEWVYKVKDMILVPPRWEWDGKQWVFHNAGWAKSGTREVVYRATPAPGGPDVAENAEKAPVASTETAEPQASTTTVYVYTGVYVAPLIVYPIWHPWYHYHWYHRHAHYRRAPAYRHRRYHYSQTHRSAHYRHHNNSPSHGSKPGHGSGRPPSSGRPPNQGGATKPSNKPSQQPSTKPSNKPSQQPSTKPSTQPSSNRGSSSGSSRNRSGSSGRSSGGGRRGGGGRR